MKIATFHLAVAVLWFRHLGDLPVVTTLVPLVFAAQASVFFFGIILTDLVMRAAGTKKAMLAHEEPKPSTVMSLLGIPADYGFLAMSMVLLGWWDGWLSLYAVLAVLNVALLGVQLGRWYRRIEASG